MDKQTLDTCLGISGSFENGKPDYTALTGDFDQQGLSVGVLQWCAGQGSLGRLLQALINSVGQEEVDGYFQVPVSPIVGMKPAGAVAYVKAHYLDEHGNPTDQARQEWAGLLGSEAGVQVQVQLALNGPLTKAYNLAEQFCPDYPDNLRVLAFFFDLVTQSGGMSNSRGQVLPVHPDNADADSVLAYIKSQGKLQFLAQVQKGRDPLCDLLLHYAYERAKLSNPQYMWDAFSRRGTIAARHGIVHGAVLDFTGLLP